MIDRSIVAAAINEERLWSLLMRVGQIGGLENGGVNRQALTALDTESKNFIAEWALAEGLSVFQDEAANFFVRLEGSRPDAEPVMVGSHLDSQPTGGKFDGAYGVIAGLEVLCAIKRLGLTPERPIEVVSWMNEEGSRFQPGAMGSSAFAGSRSLQAMADALTTDGTRVADELHMSIAATHAVPRAMASVRPFAFLEAHIEQGPVLENEGFPLGVVTGIQGIRRIRVEFRGKTAHAGTTPHRLRKDALTAATKFMARLHPLTEAREDVLRLTVGRIDVFPNSPNTVPNLVKLTIDLRHPEESALNEATNRIREAAISVDGECESVVEIISHVAPVTFGPALVDLLETCASKAGIRSRRIVSGAGHDAMHLAGICQTGMVFVPCKDGISHHESESAKPGDLATGARVIAAAAWDLANRSE